MIPMTLLLPILAAATAAIVFFHQKYSSREEFLPMHEGETKRKY